MNVFNVVTSSVISRHTRSPSLVRHISPNSHHRHSPRGLVGSSANPDVKKRFLVYFCCRFCLTLPLHEVTIPLFFVLCFSYLFFPLHDLPPSFLPFFICFVDLFLMTASWNRSGWHPRSLTGQCTSHLPLPLPLFLIPTHLFLSLTNTTCVVSLPPLCFHPSYPPPPLLSSSLILLFKSGHLSSGWIDFLFLLLISLLSARYGLNNKRSCVLLLNSAPSRTWVSKPWAAANN